jgi:hypothetical protein
MRYHDPRRPLRGKRSGKILVMFALVLSILLGMTGLVIDGGLMITARREAHNAATAAAGAAAMKLFLERSSPAAVNEALTFVKVHNGLSDATVVVNIPPTSGPQAGKSKYVEVFVTLPVDTRFIQVLGVSRHQTVSARAVAGYEAAGDGEAVICLEPAARPGLSVDGGSMLRVNGSVIVNSRSAGLDQYGDWVDWGQQQYAATTGNNSTMLAQFMQIHGGVDVVENFRNIIPNGRNPLFCRGPIVPDPLRNVPVPNVSNTPSITDWTRQDPITVNGPETRTFYPGVYENIQINTGATVTFTPGAYIFCPKHPNQGLRINGEVNITGDGVMFYFTGSNYLDFSPGFWDILDDLFNARVDGPLPPTNGPDLLPPPPDFNFGQVKFATLDVNLNSATVTLRGLNDPNGPFDKVLFYYRRRNQMVAAFQSNAGDGVYLTGFIYTKWGEFKLAGAPRFDGLFVIRNMVVSGGATARISGFGRDFELTGQVHVVE